MLVVPERKQIVLPFREDVAAVVHGAKAFQTNGKELLAVPHGAAEVKLLRNLGLDAPAPILSQYKWAGDNPYESQKTTAALLSVEPRAYVLSSMGVGKTRAALYAFDFLRQHEDFISQALIVAPLSTLVSVWEQEIFRVFPHLTTAVLHGTRKQRLQRLEDKADVYIINHDGVTSIKDQLKAKRFSVVIVDELAAYRNARTVRWKSLKPIVKEAPFVWGLTGSPTPNAPTDAFGQIKLLTPSRIRNSFRSFQQETMYQVTQFKWVPRREANDIVLRAMQPAVRYSLDECHDLPPITYSTRTVEFNKAQEVAYNDLMKHSVMEWRNEEITAVNEGAKLQKLLQIGCGFAYNEDGKGLYLDAKARLKETLSLINGAEKKVIVFAPFKWACRMLHKVLSSKFETVMITGDTPKNDRDKYINMFRNKPSLRVLVAHPGTMAHGLTLTEASTIIWYSPVHSNETWEQANARIRRPGQTSHTHIVCIQSSPVEARVYQRLQQKQAMQGVLLEMFERQETTYE